MRFNQIKYKPTIADQELVAYVLRRKEEMDTFYREKAVRLAKWARDDYEGMSDDRVGNMDLMKVSLSYPAVNQRCSSLFNNQSKAEYRTVDESKKYDVEILKKVDEYDKRVGKFNADYQDIEMTANIEGSCFFRVNWEEVLDQMGNTVGVPHISQKRVRMNDIWWDQGARTIDECNHMIERKVMTFERFQRLFYPLEGKNGFRNIRAVQPMNREYCEDNIWREEWEEYGRGHISGNYVTLWFKETLGMAKNGKISPMACVIANGIPIYESEKLFVPTKTGQENLLSWDKIDGIPTGNMVGMGIPVLIRHPQEAFNRLLTLNLAQAEISASPPAIFGPQIDWDHEDSPFEAGRVIRTRGTAQDVRNAYSWLEVPGINSGSVEMMEKLIEYIIMLTGVDVRALFVPASEKAITTVNKREIQEKLLRFSVQWNEDHGYYGLALRRLRFLQCYYPKKRTFMEEVDGMPVRKEGYLKLPLTDYETEEIKIRGRNRIKLNFKEGGYTKIDITPENIDFNVDLIIEGATTGQERDSIEKKNYLEGLQTLMSMPVFQEMVAQAPEKFVKHTLKQLNIKESDILADVKENSQNMHPARQEIQAIPLADTVLNKLGFKFPDDIPENKDYDPNEYVDIYSEFERSKQFKKFNVKAVKLFRERFDYHIENASNPYFYDIQRKKQEEEEAAKADQAAQRAQGNAAGDPNAVPDVQLEEEGLGERMKSQAAQIANMTK